MAPVRTKYVREIPAGAIMYMGEPDGPMRFVKSLGMEVPTYRDPRNDLKSDHVAGSRAHKSVDYHIPPSMRGTYVPTDLPDFDPDVNYPLTSKLKVRCGGLKPDGQICHKSAMNRTGFCSNHGGALHPADKFYTVKRGVAPTTVENLSRLDKVLLGIIPVGELSDEEISRQKIRDDNGLWVEPSAKIAPKLHKEMNAEFFKRANDYIRSNTLDMLKVMVQIAESDLNEPADRQKAAQWMVERSLGKTPDILLTNKSDKPFEQMFTDIVSGSREEYRNSVQKELTDPNVIDGEIVVIGEDEDENDEPAMDGSPVRESVSDGIGTQEEQTYERDDSGGNGEETEDCRSGGDSIDADAVIAEQQRKARERQEAKERILKARKRRFAAKAQGLDSVENVGYELKFSKTQLGGQTVTRMKLVAPEDVNLPKTR